MKIWVVYSSDNIGDVWLEGAYRSKLRAAVWIMQQVKKYWDPKQPGEVRDETATGWEYPPKMRKQTYRGFRKSWFNSYGFEEIELQ